MSGMHCTRARCSFMILRNDSSAPSKYASSSLRGQKWPKVSPKESETETPERRRNDAHTHANADGERRSHEKSLLVGVFTRRKSFAHADRCAAGQDMHEGQTHSHSAHWCPPTDECNAGGCTTCCSIALHRVCIPCQLPAVTSRRLSVQRAAQTWRRSAATPPETALGRGSCQPPRNPSLPPLPAHRQRQRRQSQCVRTHGDGLFEDSSTAVEATRDTRDTAPPARHQNQ